MTTAEARRLYAGISAAFSRLSDDPEIADRRHQERRPAEAIPVEFVVLGYPILDAPLLPADADDTGPARRPTPAAMASAALPLVTPPLAAPWIPRPRGSWRQDRGARKCQTPEAQWQSRITEQNR